MATSKRLFRFGVVGIVSNLILLLVFALLMALGFAAVWANMTVYILGVGGTYLLNRNWSFASASRHIVAAPAYAIVYFFGFCVSAGAMFILHDYLSFSALSVQVVLAIAVAIMNFTLLNRTVFSE